MCEGPRALYENKKYLMHDLANVFAEYDPCDGYKCHEYAKCYKRGGRAVCQCNYGYVGSGKYCKGMFFNKQTFFIFFQPKFCDRNYQTPVTVTGCAST